MATVSVGSSVSHNFASGLSATFARLTDRYWAGWEHYARAYSAELDQRARFPAPRIRREAGRPATAALEPQPLARVWRGRVRTVDADAFHRYLIDIGIPGYRKTTGNLGAWILRRPVADGVEFQLVSHWESRAALVAFAGADPTLPRHHPGVERFLLPDGEAVEHYDLLPDAAVRYASVRY